MNGTMTSGEVSSPAQGSFAPPSAPETNQPGVQPGMGQGAPQNGESQVEPVGSPQGGTEGGQSTGGEVNSRGRKLLVDRDELLGLRNDRRELRTQLADMQAMLEELKAAQGNQPQPNKPTRKTEQDFFADPDSRFMSLEEKLDSLEERITDRVSKQFTQVRQQDMQTARLDRERNEAVKLVHSQPGWDQADDQVLVDIVNEYGLGSLPPVQGAKAALAIFRQEQGITDKSALKDKAASFVGAPPGPAGANKVWPKAEVEKILDRFISNPSLMSDPKNKELMDQIKQAQAENRIR